MTRSFHAVHAIHDVLISWSDHGTGFRYYTARQYRTQNYICSKSLLVSTKRLSRLPLWWAISCRACSLQPFMVDVVGCCAGKFRSWSGHGIAQWACRLPTFNLICFAYYWLSKSYLMKCDILGLAGCISLMWLYNGCILQHIPIPPICIDCYSGRSSISHELCVTWLWASQSNSCYFPSMTLSARTSINDALSGANIMHVWCIPNACKSYPINSYKAR